MYESKTWKQGNDKLTISRDKMKFNTIHMENDFMWLELDLDTAKEIADHIYYLIKRHKTRY